MKPRALVLTGKIIDGTGNSTSWMPGILPDLFPGTLNVLLDSHRPDIEWHTDINIDYGKHKDSVVRIGNCLINNEPAFIIKPPRFKYIKRYNWLEIGHYERLRDKLNLKNNSRVEITFIQGLSPII